MRRWRHVVLVFPLGTGCGADEVQQAGAARKSAVSSCEHRFTAELPGGWEMPDRRAEALAPLYSLRFESDAHVYRDRMRATGSGRRCARS